MRADTPGEAADFSFQRLAGPVGGAKTLRHRQPAPAGYTADAALRHIWLTKSQN